MTTSNQVELLPCPFCGNDAYVFANSSGLVGENWPRGRCYRCGSMGSVSNHLNDEADAIRKWNTRPLATIRDTDEDAEWDRHIGILRAWGSPTSVWAADNLERLASSTPAEPDEPTGSITLGNASVQRLLDYGLLHHGENGWYVSLTQPRAALSQRKAEPDAKGGEA